MGGGGPAGSWGQEWIETLGDVHTGDPQVTKAPCSWDAFAVRCSWLRGLVAPGEKEKNIACKRGVHLWAPWAVPAHFIRFLSDVCCSGRPSVDCGCTGRQAPCACAMMVCRTLPRASCLLMISFNSEKAVGVIAWVSQTSCAAGRAGGPRTKAYEYRHQQKGRSLRISGLSSGSRGDSLVPGAGFLARETLKRGP